ncbi:MAG: YGL010W-like membrane protein [Oceanicoccus sp.]|jgi:uncharacterized membrane protein YGL010W
MQQRSLQQWLSEYSETHQNPINKRIHFVCVPVILFCTLGLLWQLPLPSALHSIGLANAAIPLIALSLIFYLTLSLSLTIGMVVIVALCIWVFESYISYGPSELWLLCAVLFVITWIGQFIGHAYEGKKPSFFKDLQFLLIGPLWILAFIYRKLSIPFETH